MQARAFKCLLDSLGRMRFLAGTDLAALLEANAEKILNLPGKMPFFATRTTSLETLKNFVNTLHPVSCDRELVRLGPDGDGGYLVPNDLAAIEACFSPGVSDVAGFELDCAEMGMKVFMADASVEQAPAAHPRFSFLRRFIGAETQDDFISLEEWVNQSVGQSRSDLLLQMDIEGFEYETLLATPSALLERFRIMVIEFHVLDYLLSEPIFSIYRQVFARILRTHVCVHIHPNNLCRPLKVGSLDWLQMAEFTFLRRDRVSNPTFATRFPHALDRDNSKNRKTFPLPELYYRSLQGDDQLARKVSISSGSASL